MIDIHCHLLWDWDDGPDDRAESMAMCRVAEKDGIKAIVITPHVFRLGRRGDNLPLLLERMTEFSQSMKGATGLEFHWGAELAFHPDLVAVVEKHRFTIDATSYVFVEFPEAMVPMGAREMLGKLLQKGLVPIISHPERNEEFRRRPERLLHFCEMGCAAQLTAGSLTGSFGGEVKKTAELFLRHNLVQVIATDAHKPSVRAPILSRGVEAAAKLVGPEKAQAMVTGVPRAMLENRALPYWGDPENPTKKRWSIGGVLGKLRSPIR